MDEQEFRRLLDLFPVVRSRNYRADEDTASQSTSRTAQDIEIKEWKDAWNDAPESQENRQDDFWLKLKMAAEKKVGKTEAEKFCEAFHKIHKKLVYKELSIDAAKRFIKYW